MPALCSCKLTHQQTNHWLQVCASEHCVVASAQARSATQLCKLQGAGMFCVMWTDRFTSTFSSSPQVHQGRNHYKAQTIQTNTGISSVGWSMVPSNSARAVGWISLWAIHLRVGLHDPWGSLSAQKILFLWTIRCRRAHQGTALSAPAILVPYLMRILLWLLSFHMASRTFLFVLPR